MHKFSSRMTFRCSLSCAGRRWIYFSRTLVLGTRCWSSWTRSTGTVPELLNSEIKEYHTFTKYKEVLSVLQVNKYVSRKFCIPVQDKNFSAISSEIKIDTVLKDVMRQVPQTVVVMTTAKYDKDTQTWLKRGMTCSSFTSVSMQPPVVSVAVRRPSRMHDLLLQVERFAIHVLSQNQVGHAIHFAKPPPEGADQFEKIPHEQDSHGIPVLQGTNAVLHCCYHSITTIGDHHVWFGEVIQANTDLVAKQPLLYYSRSFRSVGDETFIQAFENTTLPFEEWTHEAHLRMAWNYIREYGRDDAIPIIKAGIKRYNEQNKDKIERGYHETVTIFYIHIVADAVSNFDGPDLTFDEFISKNDYLTERSLLFKYYTQQTISQPEAKEQFIPPDIQALP